jgi:hypothetical protein
MHGINLQRWLIGGVVAGILIFLIEGAASTLYMEDWQAALTAHNLSMDMETPGAMAMGALFSLIMGLALVFFYAAARPRFGLGPRTAATMAIALWIGGYLPTLMGYQMMGLFPPGMLGLWALIGLVEMVIAGIVGAWLYREP